MYKGRKVIILIPAYNEEAKIGRVIERVPSGFIDTLLVVDDGSTDVTAEVARSGGAQVLSLGRVCGVGAALREGLSYARRRDHDIAVILAGNNKDEPREIPRLLDPICDQGYDFVMGSRFLNGAAFGGDIPLYRKWSTRLHPWLMSRAVGRRITESTNGFRAFNLSVLDDPGIDMSQSWLDGYALEVYLLYKVLTLDYRCTEVPCTKIYPSRKIGNTKMKPVLDWWGILKPVFLLGLGLRS